MPETSQPTAYNVRGIIYDEYNSPQPDVQVKLFEVGLRSQQELAKVKTNVNGYYSLTAKFDIMTLPEGKRPDLKIKIIDSQNKLLGESPLYFNAADNIVIDYKIGGNAAGSENEFDLLMKKITPIIERDKIKPGALKENAEYADISFLAGETGETFQAITFFNTAFVLSAETKIAPQIFYGLFSMGLPKILDELLLLTAESIINATTQAIAANIISGKFEKQLDDVIDIFNNLSAQKISAGNDERVSDLKKLFGKILSNDKQITAFAKTYFVNEATPEKFWEALKKEPGFNGVKVEQLQKLLNINRLTDNQPELAQYLFSKQSSDPDLKEMSAFAIYSKADWTKLITDAGVAKFPVWVQGETTETKTAYYAESLAQLHKELYPATFFSARMKADNQSSFAEKEQLNLFFSKNPGFELSAKNIYKPLANANFENVNKETITKELKAINRLYRLTDDYNHVNALYSKAIFSSSDIVSKYGKEQFVKQFTTTIGSDESAGMLYKKAVSVNNKAMALIAAYKTRHDINLYVIDGYKKNSPENIDFWKGYHEMFGDGELCECEHCQSVYSPSAYFVDMLAFIRSENETAFNELLRRRPDLDDILLTCKNTNTVIPYIDLVNELLEKHVAALSATDEDDALTILNQSYQTDGVAADLSAQPEHISNVAYAYLENINGDAVFSASLPLDLPLEEINAYTEKLGFKRSELMEAFYANNQPGSLHDTTLAAEVFGFSDAELNLINGSNPVTVTLPGKVKAILEKTRFNYIELLQLLETYFLNPLTSQGRSIKVKQEGEGDKVPEILTCNLDELFLAGASDAWLNKTIRFVRLWKKIGWDIYDLDRVLTALKPEALTPEQWNLSSELIVSLGNIENIRRRLNVPLKQIVSFFGDIDTAAYLDHTKEGQPFVVSLKEELFKNTVINDAAAVCAMLGISNAEYILLEPVEDFSLPNLSRLYRYNLLAKSLGITISDLKEALRITGRTADAVRWTPIQLAEFLREWEIFRSANIGVAAFGEYFKSGTDEEYTIPVNYHLVSSAAASIRELIALKNNSVITAGERKTQSTNIITTFLQTLENNTALGEALVGPLSNPVDIALKNVAQDYFGEANKATILSLTEDGMIIKLQALSLALHDYVTTVLKKSALIFEKFKFNELEILWLKEKKLALGIQVLWNDTLDIANPGLYAAFRKLYKLSLFAKNKTASSLSWIDAIDIVIKNEPNAKAAWLDKMVILYGVSETSLDLLCGSKAEVDNRGILNFNFPADYTEAANLITIIDCCKTISILGGNNDQIRALLNTRVLSEDAEAVKNLLKSKYSSKDWLDVIKPINDRLRTRRRDALTAWLIANTNKGAWRSAHDVYEWLLIDIEMDACMMTSRIRQAISSVQLYIDRCLMNLEATPDLELTEENESEKIILGTEFSEQWHTWRKQYRIWEANRKIFLYPENWLEPDLRDNKSPFFKELESQLRQNEVTEQVAKEALITYLQKLDSVAKLEIIGLFNDEAEKIEHVFGRTQNIPHQYFYRKQQHSVWTAWEKVEVDIEGDHILPVVWNGRLMLFWGAFTETQDSGGNSSSITPVGDTGTLELNSLPAQKHLELKLSWSEYKNGKWESKKVSKVSSASLNSIGTNHFSLDSVISGEQLELQVLFWLESPVFKRVGAFKFENFKQPPLYREFGNLPGIFITEGCVPNDIFVNKDENTYSFTIYKGGLYKIDFPITEFANDPVKLFSNVPGQFQLLTSHHDIKREKPVAFFYTNKQNIFYVKAVQEFKPHVPDFYPVDLLEIFARKKINPHVSKEDLNEVHDNAISTFFLNSAESNKTATSLSSYSKLTFSRFLRNTYAFYSFNHPYVCDFIKLLNNSGINSLYDPNVQNKSAENIFTEEEYSPTEYARKPYPLKLTDFSFTGSSAIYNWELFFHVPLLIATRLSQNQKFEESRKWFHYIFNPTQPTSDESGPERFWITKPFRKEVTDGVLSLLDLLGMEGTAEDLDKQLDNWERNPFNPHAVARLRMSAYMRNTILKYIDNLIAWGDQLFRQDTIESINEATLLYITASNILGKKTEVVPARAKPVKKSFLQIKNELDRFSNAKSEIESFISPSSGNDNILMPYFCLPKNDYLMKYWDTVADRLFKIRHCMNIEGVVRQLPLFEPSIDPALLVRVTAAGLDINTILNDITLTFPNYRFQTMLQKANELCNDVKGLGSSLLSALEKKDGEELAVLRSAHELKMLEMVKDVKEKQRDEANETLNSLQASKIIISERLSYYNKNADVYLNSSEKTYFDLTNKAIDIQAILEMKNYLASMLAFTPEFKLGSGFTLGSTFGGSNLARAADFGANALQSIASLNRLQAESANMKGGYDRRMDEWKFQEKSAGLELKQIDKQILAAEIRLSIAEKDLENHDLQMEQSGKIDDYMRSKFTSAELYDWMLGQLSTVYFQSYHLAYETAKKTEKCMQYELGIENTSFIQFGYWDSLKKGLLSGEKLQYDLRRLENAYLEQNTRGLEITKHISIAVINPVSLLQLKETGSCSISVPEELFDMDFPGHYFRRIKSVSISIPCIAGPYTSINASLRLTKNEYRIDKTATSADNYRKTQEEINNPGTRRFRSGLNPVSAIATSNAQMDSGMFELNFRDERYLPFEGAGVASTWNLELMTDPSLRQFNYQTISDVIIHLRYTSKEDAGLKLPAINNLKQVISDVTASGMPLSIAFNIRHDFAGEWLRFINTAADNSELALSVSKSMLPYFAENKNVEIANISLFAKKKNAQDYDPIPFNSDQTINFDASVKLFRTLINDSVTRITTENDLVFLITMNKNEVVKLENLFLALSYKLS